MSAKRKIGTAYQEALLALSEQTSRIFREEVGDQHQVDAYLIQGDTIICVSVSFLLSGREAWVPLELGIEEWSDARRQRIVHEASHVIEQRLRLERLAAEFVAGKIRGVIDAYS